MPHHAEFQALSGLTLQALLNAFSGPAFVVTHQGLVLFSNLAAQQRAWPFPSGLKPRGCATWRHPHMRATCVRLEETRPVLYAVMFQGDALAPAPLDAQALPKSLQQVAQLAAAGLKDNQLAAALGMPLATVRTYIKRLYARVGVHNRAELLARLDGPHGARSHPQLRGETCKPT